MTCSIRDYQKQRLYDWERLCVSPFDKNIVPYDNLQAIVDYIWKEERLQFPPKVMPLPKQVTRKWACANRNCIEAPEAGLPTWVLIHELCHSLTLTFDDMFPKGGAHGPIFVGVYMKLLEKYLKLPILMLMSTAKDAKVDFDIYARPVFLDN